MGKEEDEARLASSRVEHSAANHCSRKCESGFLIRLIDEARAERDAAYKERNEAHAQTGACLTALTAMSEKLNAVTAAGNALAEDHLEECCSREEGGCDIYQAWHWAIGFRAGATPAGSNPAGVAPLSSENQTGHSTAPEQSAVPAHTEGPEKQPAGACDDRCASCGECGAKADCAASSRLCGHHCNHSWSHDECCWCGTQWGENGVEAHVTPKGGGSLSERFATACGAEVPGVAVADVFCVLPLGHAGAHSSQGGGSLPVATTVRRCNAPGDGKLCDVYEASEGPACAAGECALPPDDTQ